MDASTETRLLDDYRQLLEQRGLTEELARRAPESAPKVRDFIDQMRATAAAEGATVSLADFLREEDLMEAAPDEGVLQPVLDGLATEVTLALSKMGFDRPSDILVRQYPTGSMNAQACRVPAGHLLLINSGLMMFIYQAAKIISFSMRFTDYDSQGNLVEMEELGTPQYSMVEIEAAFAEVVLSYVLRRDTRWAKQYPAQGGPRALMMWMTVHAAEFFVVAHELAHVVLGHLESPNALHDETRLDSGWARWIEKSLGQEFEADSVAVRLLITNLGLRINDPLAAIRPTVVMSGPMLFFALDELVTRVRRALDEPASTTPMSTHPSSPERSAALRRAITDVDIPDLLDVADVYASWVQEKGDRVMDRIVALLQARDNE